MKTKEIIGIDVSKLSIDACIHSKQFVLSFKNTISGFKEMLNWIAKNSPYDEKESLFVFEHTGMYSHNLSLFLSDLKRNFVIVSGLEIKRSMGIVRGKDDKVDAKRIALYGYRLRDELRPSKIPSKTLIKLKSLMSLRNKLVKQQAGYKGTYKEQKLVYKFKDNEELFTIQETMIKALTKQIKKIENAIQKIINKNEDLKNTFKLVTSIKGIGQQTALVILVYTDSFTKFKNWRKFASYCGIAPFPYQ